MNQFLAALLIVASCSLDAFAQVSDWQRVPTLHRGSVRSDGRWLGGTRWDRYEVGLDELGLENRNYFSFDLTRVTETISAAQLTVELFWYESADASETFELRAVSNPGLFGDALAYFNDIGSGEVYFTNTYVDADELFGDQLVLNAAGIAAMNAARGGVFEMGGLLSSLSGTHKQMLFDDFYLEAVSTLTIQTVPVPEPSSWVLVLIGCTALLFFHHRRRC